MRYKIVFQGRVQGVGFRPFVYRTAQEYGIAGTVSNNEEGVLIYASGAREQIANFYRELLANPPSIARIRSHSMEPAPETEPQLHHAGNAAPGRGLQSQDSLQKAFNPTTVPDTLEAADFSILPSVSRDRLNLQLTPDFALCPDCQSELHTPGNRRNGYPFISCTNCGPRWALTRHFPFERENTSMQDFPMCPCCRSEYADPLDRRFHSQTQSCPDCGIAYWLTDAKGDRLPVCGPDCFGQMAGWLEEGRILAIKNNSGYLLVCDARKAGVIAELRKRKKRPSKPFAILYPGMEILRRDFQVPEAAQKALASAERPIVLLPTSGFKGRLALEAIAPGLDELGVMLPYSGILSMLATAFPYPVVATSGNLHGSPICASTGQAEAELGDVADYFMHHDLQVLHPQDDSVLRFERQDAWPILLRRARGYAPNFDIPAGRGAGSGLLALGADLKSSIGLIPNDFIYLSQYLGNLSHFEVYERFESTVSSFCELFDQPPATVLTDAHPGYQSTVFGIRFAREHNLPHRAVPHHRAHFAALLGEHCLWENREPVLGVIWDGTGFGEDGHIWGGEFFSYAGGEMDRVGQFEYFPWLAADKMSLEPRLSLMALCGDDIPQIRDKFSTQEWDVYSRLRGRNGLQTSSAGRVFDAVASLLNCCDRMTFEGEAAMYLEALARSATAKSRNTLAFLTDQGHIPSARILLSVVAAQQAGRPREELAADFIHTLASLILEKADRGGYRHLGFSGGVFQNALLVSCIRELNNGKRDLYFHRDLSPNDENIAFGQMMYHLHCRPEDLKPTKP